MHSFGGGIHWRGNQLLFIFGFCLLHFTSAESQPPVDTNDFKTLLMNTDTYVDRSLLIEELMFGRGCCGIVVRPKGWGKTLNMNMLQRFFDVETYPNGTLVPEDLQQNRVLFTGGNVTLEDNKTIKVLKPLKIVAQKAMMKRQGNHPVIFLNLTGIDGTTYQEFQDGIKARVLELFKKFEYLRSSSNFNAFESTYLKKYLEGRIYSANIIVSVNFLTRLLYRHFGKKVMVFVDDYDTPVLNAYQQMHRSQPEEYMRVLYFMRSLYVQSFHMNEFLEKGFLNGVVKLHLLKVVYFYSFLDKKYSKHYGFHQEDLDDLLANVSFTADREKIKDWYGYKFNNSVQLYHPGSIMRYMATNGVFDYYWLYVKCTGIDKVLLSDDLQAQLRNLSKGRSITYFANFTEVSNFDQVQPINKHVILLFSGFLTPVGGQWSDNEEHELAPANLQVKHLLQLKVLEWVAGKLNVTVNELPELLADTLEGKVEQFRATLQQRIALLNHSSMFRTASDVEFLYDGLMISTEKTLMSNQTLA